MTGEADNKRSFTDPYWRYLRHAHRARWRHDEASAL